MAIILIVEDEQLFVTLARDGLEKAGHAVRITASGDEARQILETEPVQAVILDLLMPELDGLRFLAQIRQAQPDVPVVVVSGREAPRTEAEARRLGVVECLRKPLSVEELVRTVGASIAPQPDPETNELPQLARLQQNAVALSNMVRWDTLGKFLKNHTTFFQRVIDLIADALGVEIVSLMLVDETDGTLRIAHAKGLGREVQRGAVRRIGEGISGRVAQTGEPLLIRDLSLDPAYGKARLHPRYRTNSLMCVPLKVNGKTIGVLNANNKVTGKPFNGNDLALFTTFSCLVSLSLATAQLFGRLARSVDELATANAQVARVNADLEARVRELEVLRGPGTAS